MLAIRTFGVVFILVSLQPVLAVAQDPKPKAPAAKLPAVQSTPPIQKQPPARLPAVDPSVRLPAVKPLPKKLVLTAQLERALAEPRSVRTGSLRWSCRGTSCTTMDHSPKTALVDLCLTLKSQVGTIQAFGDGQRRLSTAELKLCNRPLLDLGAGQVAFGDGQPGARLPAAGPGRMPASQPEEPRQRVPLSGGAPRALPPDMHPLDADVIHPGIGPLPELGIIEVRRFAGSDRAIRVGETVPVEVVVRNTGQGDATVRAGAPGGRPPSALIRYGPVASIRPGETAVLQLELVAIGNRFVGDRFETTVFLFNPPADGDNPFGNPFRDRISADNEYRVSFPFDRPLRYDVLSTLEQVEILDDCDNVSEGDWFVHYTIAEVRGDAVVQMVETYWPDRNNPTDVDSGSTRRLDRLLRLSSVSPDSRLLIAVSAIDCDADTPFSWGFTLPHASLLHAFGVTLATGPWTAALMDCGGEEIWEASGTADNVGTQAYVVEPEEWQAGFVGRYRRDFQSADCDPHPFTPTVRVEASLR